MQPGYLLIQKSTTLYPKGWALESTLLLVVYFKNRHRKCSFAQVFYEPLFISETIGGRVWFWLTTVHLPFSLCHVVNMGSSCFRALTACKDPVMLLTLVAPISWLLPKCSLSCLTCSYLAHPPQPPAQWYLCLCICTRLSASSSVCVCIIIIIFQGGGGLQPVSLMRPGYISQCRGAVVALQHTHELLKAVCGRWHSPIFPQPRRHWQMVGVKMLNIKQLRLRSFPYKPFFVRFWCFLLYTEANKEQLMALSASRGFQSVGFSPHICCFGVFLPFCLERSL